MKYPDIARRFSLILAIRGISQAELAQKAGLDKSFISHYVHGSHCPSNIKAQQIADALNVNPLWLMGLSDVMEIKKPVLKLDDRSQEAIDLFRDLPKEQQDGLLVLMRSLKSQGLSVVDPQ